MVSLLDLHSSVVVEYGHMLGIDTARDVLTLARRVQAEGESFLTITLPSYEAAILRGLETGRLAPNPAFKSRGRLPVLFRGFVELIFSRQAELLADPNVEAIRALRQICLLTKKLERDVSPARVRTALEAYVRTDEGLPDKSDVSDVLRDRFRSMSEVLFRPILDELENRIAAFDLIPRHGPGATAEGFSPAQKWEFSRWYESIDHVFPSNFYASHDVTKFVACVAPEHEDPVRVITVPKTLKAPRIIAIEPGARQYVQQAVARVLYRELRRHFPASLDLFDQRTNQAWAWYGSITGDVSTIDLSEASDRVPLWLVELLVGSRPHLHDALLAARSSRAVLPDGRELLLRKYASMGSALTFPLQSMVFYTCAALAGGEEFNRRDSNVSVFGDDIIVPTRWSTSLIGILESLGLKVNKSKSYLGGHFKESCGKEYMSGHDVTVAKLRHDFPTSGRDAQKIGSLVEFRNDLYQRGLWQTCRIVDEYIRKLIRFRPAPVGTPAICRWTFLRVEPDRENGPLQRPELKLPCLVPKARKYTVNEEGALLKFFLNSVDVQTTPSKWDPSERPVAFTIHNRWTPI